MSTISNQVSNANANVNFQFDNSTQVEPKFNNRSISNVTPETESPIAQPKLAQQGGQGAIARTSLDGMPAQMMKASVGDRLKAQPDAGEIVTKGPKQETRYDRPECDGPVIGRPVYREPIGDPYSNYRPNCDPPQYDGNNPIKNYGPSNDGGVQRPKTDLEKALKRLEKADQKLQKAEELIARYKQNCMCQPEQNPSMQGPGGPQNGGGNNNVADQIKQIQDSINKIGQQLGEISKQLQMQKNCPPMQSPGMNMGGINDPKNPADSILTAISNLLSEFIKKLQELLKGSDKGAGQGGSPAQGASEGGAPAGAGQMTAAMQGAGKAPEAGNAQPANGTGAADGSKELLAQIEQLLQQILAKLTELLKQVQNSMGATNPQMMAKQMLA